MNREKAIEIFKRLKENAPNEMHLETVGTAQELFDMAIQALSQEPCDELVSREAVIKTLHDTIFQFFDVCGDDEETPMSDKDEFLLTINKAISNNIKALPSVTPKSGKWIPVSERLPEDGTYLVTVERMCGTPSVNIRSFAKNLYSVDEYDFHNKKGKSGWYDYDSEYGYWEDEKVTAWLPLPKPYEPQESEARNESKG